MLQNPVALLDERGHIIAQSDPTDTMQSINTIRSDNMKALSDSDGRVGIVGNRTEPEAMYVSLTSGASRFTLICTASERPLYASDEIVLDSLAGFLRLMLSERANRLMVTQNRRENDASVSAFRSLFANDEHQSSALTTLQEFGWLESGEYAILAIEPFSGDLRAAQANAICSLFESTFEGSCAFSLAPVIAGIIQVDHLESDHIVLTLRSFAAENKLLIGICEPYAGFSLLQDRLKQAKLALDHAEQHDGVARFSDVMEAELAAVMKMDFPKELLCMRSVLALSRYDRQHETNYLETAEQYVANHFNAVKTAGELFIHRSTFLYRLERIKVQFGLDLDDRNVSLLLLLLSFRIASELR
jgi:sugar diacid utilization regulator